MKFEMINKIVSFLDYYTFGIYLIHWYFLKLLIKVFNINVQSVIYRFFSPFVVIMLCVFVIYFIRKIPIIKKIVP